MSDKGLTGEARLRPFGGTTYLMIACFPILHSLSVIMTMDSVLEKMIRTSLTGNPGSSLTHLSLLSTTTSIPKMNLTFGGELIYYDFKPAESVGVSDGIVTDISLAEKYALENALYIDNTQKIGDAITIRYGLRLSAFQYYGPGNKYEYEDTEPGESKTLVNVEAVERRELIQSYANLEPRASIAYRLDDNKSIKASYTRTNQYIHLVSNTAAVTPIDVWTPSTNNIQPQQGDQYALGYNTVVGKDDLEVSVEGYFRNTQNQLEYVNGADLFINELIEGDLISGIGRAYGLEFSLKKNTGKLNGWVSYTIGRSELKTEGINEENWYPARFDQLHNLSVFANYDFNERSSFSANFSYISGTPITAPTSRYTVQGITYSI